jgi:hypothetical protein
MKNPKPRAPGCIFPDTFGYGCAVFMQSDIVNFQHQGWRSEEDSRGLGTRFGLQGGTQNNLAVVKAEVGGSRTIQASADISPRELSPTFTMQRQIAVLGSS